MSEVTTITDVAIPRESILNLQKFITAGISCDAFVDAAGDLPLEHSFIPGAYARQMFIPQGTIVVGKIHRFPCFNFIMSGRLTVFAETGIRDVIAPFFFVSGPGEKRVSYAHEDTIWVCVHGSKNTDLDALEEELIAPTYDDLYPQTFIDAMKGEE